MYQYDKHDLELVQKRAAQFRHQVERRLKGELTEAQFRALRLMNGLYIQLHAYMLRVAIPYGTLSSKQMRMLAHIARRYDKNYGHFTTRQNIQFNWLSLEDVPKILEELASVEMHAIQTSGNCIRNVTSDPYAGVIKDEVEDARPWCEMIRQWSSLHPEFSYLPRKFKIAVTASSQDRAAIHFHDIGLHLIRNEHGEKGFCVYVGGGQGRTPMVAKKVKEFLPTDNLLPYLEAILRVYNMYGRRDNIYKARVKILVHALGREKITQTIQEHYDSILALGTLSNTGKEMERIKKHFTPPSYDTSLSHISDEKWDPVVNVANEHEILWHRNNVLKHVQSGYAIVSIPLKAVNAPPGDCSDKGMDILADLSEEFGFGEIRVTHSQNVVLPDIRQQDLSKLYQQLQRHGFATPNNGHITDQITCPGLDYCSLATARSIPVAQDISKHFESLKKLENIGPLQLKISGCINACGHHHIGHIGILGLERRGVETYQITLGGSGGFDASVGRVVGAGFTREELIPALDRIVQVYLDERQKNETFITFCRRVGQKPFREILYNS